MRKIEIKNKQFLSAIIELVREFVTSNMQYKFEYDNMKNFWSYRAHKVNFFYVKLKEWQ